MNPQAIQFDVFLVATALVGAVAGVPVVWVSALVLLAGYTIYAVVG